MLRSCYSVKYPIGIWLIFISWKSEYFLSREWIFPLQRNFHKSYNIHSHRVSIHKLNAILITLLHKKILLRYQGRCLLVGMIWCFSLFFFSLFESFLFLAHSVYNFYEIKMKKTPTDINDNATDGSRLCVHLMNRSEDSCILIIIR